LAKSASGKQTSVLRKLAWTGLSAGAVIAARRAAAKVWRIATGESPPTKA